MAEPVRKWSIRIVAKDSVGILVYEVCQIVATNADAMGLVRGMAELRRPAAIATPERTLWLHDSDLVIAVPEPE